MSRRTIVIENTEHLTLDFEDEEIQFVVNRGVQAAVFCTIKGDVTMHVDVPEGAELAVTCLQSERATIAQSSSVGRNAVINWKNVSLSSVRHVLKSTCSGAGATSNVDWAFYAHEDEVQTIDATNVFLSQANKGNMVLRGVAEDHATIRCDGMIDIGHGGGGTDAFLTEEVLMLDKTAKVDALPGLEIKTNDVKASHSATVSQLTDTDLFYFASRGIEEPTARKLFIEGFLGSIARDMPDEVGGKVTRAIERKYEFRHA